MKINVVSREPTTLKNACRIVGVFENGKLAGSAAAIDKASGGSVRKLIERGDFVGELGQSALLHDIKGAKAERVLLVGFGKRTALDANKWRTAVKAMAKNLLGTKASSAITDIPFAINCKELKPSDACEQLCQLLYAASYRFAGHSRQKQPSVAALDQLSIVAPSKQKNSAERSALSGLATAQGMAMTRDLGNLAPNICTPLYLESIALELDAKFDKISSSALNEDDMAALGMEAFLAVSRGSEQPGRLVIMQYQGRKKSGKPIVLVGKGVTFDTGGISIKSSDGMDEMKYDMCGAATVFGVMQAVATLDLDINVIGVVAAAENMPDGKACRPGDVVTTMSGQSVEILNTDAEGRLVLCDALTYVEKFKPAVVIDMATLTGACIIALGHVASAVIGNNDKLVQELLNASQASGDRAWQLPLWDEYQQQLDSNFADMGNIGGRPAGTITAACFLSRFTEKYTWAHLDIAGIAWHSGKDKGATGRPVPMLMKYLSKRADK